MSLPAADVALTAPRCFTMRRFRFSRFACSRLSFFCPRLPKVFSTRR